VEQAAIVLHGASDGRSVLTSRTVRASRADAAGRLLGHRRAAARAQACLLRGDLLLQYLDALEQEVEEKGGVQQELTDYFAKIHRGRHAADGVMVSLYQAHVPEAAVLMMGRLQEMM
jgi:hypothetical protein